MFNIRQSTNMMISEMFKVADFLAVETQGTVWIDFIIIGIGKYIFYNKVNASITWNVKFLITDKKFNISSNRSIYCITAPCGFFHFGNDDTKMEKSTRCSNTPLWNKQFSSVIVDQDFVTSYDVTG